MRRQQALELRRQGKRYDEIAAELGISESRAWKLVQQAYQRSLQLSDEEANFQRKLDLERIDAALAAIWPKVRRGELTAIDRLVPLLNRRARLLGLDMPERQETDIGEVLAGVLERLADRGGETDHNG